MAQGVRASGHIPPSVPAYPLTVLMFGQLLAFYVLPALISSTPAPAGTWPLVAQAFAVIIGSVFVTEFLVQRFKSDRHSGVNFSLRLPNPARKWLAPYAVLGLAVLAVLGLLITTSAGVNAYGAQGNDAGIITQVGKFLEVASLPAVALSLMMIRNRLGSVSAYLAITIVGLAELYSSLVGGFLINLASFIFLVVAMGYVTRTISLKLLLGILLAAIIVFPTLYDFRNTTRMEVDSRVSFLEPVDRIRQDTWMGTSLYAQREAISLPSDLGMLRYAIPRPLDPNRPPLDVGQQLNVSIGGSYNSPTTFTQPGNIVFLRGTIYLACFYSLVALAIYWLNRPNNLYRLTVLSALVSAFVWIGGQYPGSIALFVQSSLYGFVILWFTWRVVDLLVGNRNAARRVTRDISGVPASGGLGRDEK